MVENGENNQNSGWVRRIRRDGIVASERLGSIQLSFLELFGFLLSPASSPPVLGLILPS